MRPAERLGADYKRSGAEMRAEILSHLRNYMSIAHLKLSPAVPKFVDLYNCGEIEVSAQTRAKFQAISTPSVLRWRKKSQRGGLNQLAPNYGNRAGTGLIDKQPELRDFILSMLANNHLMHPKQIHNGMLELFGRTGLELPGADRTTRAWIAKWKKFNPSEFLLMSNPDAWKGRHMMSLGKADSDITTPLQLAEIDGSPVDILCTDGRYYLTAMINVGSRLGVGVITKTASTESSLLAVRKFIVKYGVPAVIRCDQGSETKSAHYLAALEHLEIARDMVPVNSGDRKPHVERFIGTIMHGFMPWLPGFIGCSVAEQQAIRNRCSFADRLGKGTQKVFAVKLTAAELLRKLDDWLDRIYSTDHHGGLNGRTPKQMWEGWLEAGGTPRRVPDVALEVLLANGGYAMVGKGGIKFAGGVFWHPDLTAFVGQRAYIKLSGTWAKSLFSTLRCRGSSALPPASSVAASNGAKWHSWRGRSKNGGPVSAVKSIPACAENSRRSASSTR